MASNCQILVSQVLESTLEAALSSGDVPGLKSTQDIDKYADFITTAISTAVDKAIPKSKSGRPESQPISDENLALIKEKRKLRRQYSQAHDHLVKTRINQLQKEIKDNLRIESQASWEKFCNDISVETNHTESWRKIKNFLKPKGQRDYPALRLDAKTAKTNADKVQLFAESVERHFGIQSNNFDSKHFDEVNQFIEDNYEYFYPPADPDDYRSDIEIMTLWLMLIIRLCDLMQKPPRLTLIRCNSLPKASKDTSVFRVTILIQNTSMRSISLSRIIMNIFILLKTPMITDRT